MGKTSIAWTDHSWPVINGCRRVSPGCGGASGVGGCYAERLAATRLSKTPKYHGLAVFGENGPRWTGKSRLWVKDLDMPLRLKKPSRIFVADMGDLFYEGVTEDEIAEVFGVMAVASDTFHGPGDGHDKIGKPFPLYEGGSPVQMRSPRHLHGPHVFQVLTKRSRRLSLLRSASFRRKVAAAAHRWAIDRRCAGDLSESIDRGDLWPLPNVWIGVSVEDQKRALERLPDLIKTPAAVRFVSAEPLLEAVDLSRWLKPSSACECSPTLKSNERCGGGWIRCNMGLRRLNWVIVGGESGPGARPFDLAWARSLRDQCAAAGVAYFLKQAGARASEESGLSQTFSSFQQWVDKARSWLRGGSWTLVDAKGRVCLDGADMMRARDEGAFPVVASPLLKLKSRKGGDLAELPEDLRVQQMPEVRS